MLRETGIGLVGVMWISLAAMAQQPATAPANGQLQPAAATRPSGSGQPLLLDVVVTGKSGKAVAGLQQQDFTVLDNKRPSEIVSFHAESGTAHAAVPGVTPEIILILDEVNTPYDRAVYAREGVVKFLRANDGKLAYPVTLGFLSDDGLQMQTAPTLDGAALATALEHQVQALRAIERGAGVYGAEERLKISMDALENLIEQEQAKPNRKMVIWVSPGWPLLSGPRDEISASQEQHVFRSVIRLSAQLREERMTLYSVDPSGAADAGESRSTFYENFTKGLTRPKDAVIGDMGLQVLAQQTGGRVIFGNEMIDRSLETCAEDLGAYYTLTIDAAPADRPNEFHELQVKVARPKVTARTRNGYYTQP
ncbi:MAG TPA: VWA domain-containing protein [Acidobacteriaceae bacterium]|nr:VWA domain-containing protein [Acidobacteriaceae bacterium]